MPTKGFILIVDRDTALRQLASFTLQKHGYRVLEARTAEEGIRLFQNLGSDIKLLIADVALGEISGLELADRLIEMRPDLLIVLTYSEQSRPAARTDYPVFAKPFQPHELVAIVQTMMGDAPG